MALPKHVSAIVVERHDSKQEHQKGLPFKCDICDCKVAGHEQVVRALSQKWTVDNKKGKLTSQVVLAEVKVADFPTLKAAKAALLAIVGTKQKLTVQALNKMKRPLDCGYTEAEVFEVLAPYVMKLAKRYATERFDESDGIQQAFLGTRQALECDRARAPFGTYVYRHLQTKIRRKSMESGTVKHGERDCDLHGMKGVQEIKAKEVYDGEGKLVYRCKECEHTFSIRLTETIAKTMECPKCENKTAEPMAKRLSGKLLSIDAPLSDEAGSNMQNMIESQIVPDPLDALVNGDLKERRHELVQKLMQFIQMSENQRKIVTRQYGLDGKDPQKGAELAQEILGPTGDPLSRQRICQQSNKVIDRMAKFLDEQGIEFDDLF